MRDDLRDLLEDASVGPRRPLDMPRALERARRSRRHRRLGTGALVLAFLIPAAVFAANLREPRETPVPPLKGPAPTVSEHAPRRCSAQDLRVDVEWGAAAGSYGADVTFSHRGDGSCRLYRNFRVELRAGGRDRAIASARNLADGRPPWVVINQVRSAGAVILWSNWCEELEGPFYYLVHPGEGSFRIDIEGSASCSGGTGTNLGVVNFKRLDR